jgi:KUP system potassium uptake protein
MLITTAFATLIMVLIWKTPLILSLTFLIVVGGVELIYLLAVLLKVRDAGWVTLALALALVSVMYIWHYGTRMKYQSELDQRISMDYMLKLGPELGTKRVEGVGLLYNELIQGVPAIFGYFLKKLPATHSTIVFVCIKYINVPAVPQTQRFIFRRVCPREYHIFRCVARYGYKDVRKESHEIFEELLLKSLETFIHRDSQEYVLEFGDVQRPSDDNDNGVSPPAVGRNEPVPDELTQPLLQRIADENIDDIDVVETPESLDFREPVADSNALKELLLLEEAKKKGRVVYLIGHADVRAKKESWFFRKLVINYFYSFLSRNCRATSDLLNVPPTKRLQVGMTYMV